jgi:hypothetical protein
MREYAMPPIYAELIRQALRWLGVWLMTTNILPPDLAALVDDPETVALVAGFASYALAELGWIGSKVRK